MCLLYIHTTKKSQDMVDKDELELEANKSVGRVYGRSWGLCKISHSVRT